MPRRMKAMLWFQAVLLFSACAGCVEQGGGEAENPVVAEQVTAERLEKIGKALGSKDWKVARRALLEAVPLVADQPKVAERILDHLPYTAWNVPLEGLAVRALGEARRESAEAVVHAYQEDPAKRASLLLVLGRMGGNGRGAAPFLRSRLTALDVEPDEKMAIKVVLASMQQSANGELNEIAEALERGGSPWEITTPIFYIGRNEWMSDGIKASLLDALSQAANGERRLGAILVLATLGHKADPVVAKAIARVFDSQPQGGHGDMESVWSGLALAAVDRARMASAMRTAFCEFGGCWTQRELFCIPDVFCSAVLDDRFLSEVKFLVSDTDARVARSAVSFLTLIGPAAHSTVPELLRLVESASTRHEGIEEELCLAAAEALGMVAMPSDLPRIRELGEKPGLPPEVRGSLKESIRAIELGD